MVGKPCGYTSRIDGDACGSASSAAASRSTRTATSGVRREERPRPRPRRAIAEDRKGSVWVEPLAGLSRFQNGHFTTLTTATDRRGRRADAGRRQRRLHLGRRELGVGADALHPAKWTRWPTNLSHESSTGSATRPTGCQTTFTWKSGSAAVRSRRRTLWVATGPGIDGDRSAPAAAHPPARAASRSIAGSSTDGRCPRSATLELPAADVEPAESSSARSACQPPRSSASATCSRARTTNGSTPAHARKRPTRTCRRVTIDSG